ncbi:MAG: hypothetical protein ACLU9S_05440 [Oscillospiraceae bacterium]
MHPGDLVNLGAGIPSHAANYIGVDSGMMIQTECGTIGGGPLAAAGEEDYTLIAPDTRPTTPGCTTGCALTAPCPSP